jgi:uncharacterized protein (DUF433 family)
MRDPHLTLNPRGVPCLDGTRHRVIDLVADHVVQGYRAAHLVEPSPDLTPAHVHATLTSDDGSSRRPRRQRCTGRAAAPVLHAASHSGRGTRAAGRVMRRRSMEVHVKAAITAGLRQRGMDVVSAQEDGGTRLDVLDLEVVCQVIDPEDLAHRIESLPLT